MRQRRAHAHDGALDPSLATAVRARPASQRGKKHRYRADGAHTRGRGRALRQTQLYGFHSWSLQCTDRQAPMPAPHAVMSAWHACRPICGPNAASKPICLVPMLGSCGNIDGLVCVHGCVRPEDTATSPALPLPPPAAYAALDSGDGAFGRAAM
eukprot:365241-Chlamydomonas_euryale.AAC.8